MCRKHGRKWAALGLLLLLLAPSPATAGPFLGSWSWWQPCRDCPRGEYSPLHYWAPNLFRARAVVHPSNLDQYPPGPCPEAPAGYQFTRYPCPAIPPTPTTPYADPTGYYGRP